MDVVMSYDLHITRDQEHPDAAGSGILLEEWLELVASDTLLSATGSLVATVPDGSVIQMHSPGAASWSGPLDSAPVWFHHLRGRVSVRYPDLATRGKTHELATALGGRVLGDQGEEYGPDGEQLR